MPLYDYSCPVQNCPTTYRDVYFRLSEFSERIFDWCPRHGHRDFELLFSPPAVDDWGNEGSEGRFFEHLAPEGKRFRDRASYREFLRENGLREKHYTGHNDPPSPATMRNAKEMLARGG